MTVEGIVELKEAFYSAVTATPRTIPNIENHIVAE
jgi:hypothetical protein